MFGLQAMIVHQAFSDALRCVHIVHILHFWCAAASCAILQLCDEELTCSRVCKFVLF